MRDWRHILGRPARRKVPTHRGRPTTTTVRIALGGLLALLASAAADAQVSSKKFPLSTGQAVPVGELEAVGRLQAVGSCTATLISERLVLTAGHCVCPSQMNAVGCASRAQFTLTDVRPVDDRSTPQDESRTRGDVTVWGNVIVHPQYTAGGWLRKDLALVVLDRAVWEVAQGIQPIPVAGEAHRVAAGHSVTLVGYGNTGQGCAAGAMGKRQLTLTVSQVVPDAIRFNHPGDVSCPGDSGGPALNAAGWVVGVASWTNSTDESTYRPAWESLDWIHSVRAASEPQPVEGNVVVSGTSRDLDAYRPPRQYRLKDPPAAVVGMAIASSDDVVYAWYLDGTVSAGDSTNLTSRRRPYAYSLPPGKRSADIIDLAIARNDHVYAWYRDGTVSSGSSSDLDLYRPPQPYSLPPGKSPEDIVGIGIAGSNDRVFVWYADGTVSSGNSRDLDASTPPQSFSLPAGRSAQHILAQGIAGSNDHVYTWFKPYLR